MYQAPRVEEIIEVAQGLGITLSPDQAEVYRHHTIHQLDSMQRFLDSDIEPEVPGAPIGARDAGHAPSPEEDPFRAWLWKCSIEGASEGLLAGKTVSFKDNIAVAGIPMSVGAPALANYRPDFDATIVTRVLGAGGKVIGKNTLSPITAKAFPAPINPHNATHVTGGSSSGSGVALAAHEVDISFGGDQGGSIRIPAAFCALVGLKPTFGLVSHMGITYLADPSIDHVGPMALHTRDVALALQAVAGYDELDPRQSRAVPERLEVLSELDNGAEGLRVGVLVEGFDEAKPEVAAAVRDAIDTLAGLGAKVSEVSVPLHAFMNEAFLPIRTEGGRDLFEVGIGGFGHKTFYPASLIAAVNALGNEHFDELSPAAIMRHIAAHFSRRDFRGLPYAKAQNVRRQLVDAYDRALAEFDVLVMPTARHLPEPVPTPPSDPLEALEASLLGGRWLSAQNTQPFNYSGHPALAVPCAKVGGLPTSMQLVGRYFDDALLLRVAQAYESAVDWDALTSAQLGAH